jgi:hypothetical protein
MWTKYKDTKKQALKLWNTFKKNGKRMYDCKEIGAMLHIDRRTISRWVFGTCKIQ